MRVYCASLTKHASFWLSLRETWGHHGVHIISTWPLLVLKGEDQNLTPVRAYEVWIMDADEIMGADAVLVYAAEGDVLRGALVEAGMGIALGKVVIVVGDSPSYGSWQWHPAVHHAADFEEALNLLKGPLRMEIE